MSVTSYFPWAVDLCFLPLLYLVILYLLLGCGKSTKVVISQKKKTK